MPTILRWKGFRFYFYSNESYEPAHIHVDKDECSAKFWLHPVSLASSHHFSDNELNLLLKKVTEHQKDFYDAWNRYFAK